MTRRLSQTLTKKKGYHHGALRGALLSAVEELLRTHGPHALSLRGVARKARVSHSAPAHHYKNKCGLLTAFAIDGFEKLSLKVGASVIKKSPRNGAEMLEVLGTSYVEFAMENPHHFTMMYRTDLLNLKNEDYQIASRRSVGILVQSVNRCVEEGLIPKHFAEEAIAALWALAYGLVMLKFSGRLGENLPSMRKPDFATRAIHFFIQGLLIPASRKKRPAKKPT